MTEAGVVNLGVRLVAALLLIIVLVSIARALLQRWRLAWIARQDFPPAVVQRFRERRPGLNDEDVEQVRQGLRDYFHICCRAGRRRMVSMPSQVVDELWHEFILFTHSYERFCGKALGRFLHHVPAEAMRSKTQAQDGIKRAWRLACQKEGIAPRHPLKLPLLFRIDQELSIENGFIYTLDCRRDSRGNVYCGGDIGCGGGCGGGGDSDGGDSGGGDSGCGGGCGGD